MKITKEKIISIILSFFIDKLEMSIYSLAKKTDTDSKSLKAWTLQTRQTIRPSSFRAIISALKADIVFNFQNFSNYFIEELGNAGIDREYVIEIFDSTTDIDSIINQLLLIDIDAPKLLQNSLGTAKIIHILKTLFSQYRDYFQLSEQVIGESEAELIYSPLIYTGHQSADSKNYVPELNYLILKFPNAYHIGLILSNYTIDFSNQDVKKYYFYMIEKLKTQNNLKMLLFITDIDKKEIPFSVQSSLMKKYNLFYEFVKKTDLQKIVIQGLEVPEENSIDLSKMINLHRYAHLIFERFMSYLSVISNEIIFMPYLEKLRRELDSENSADLIVALNKILVSYEKRTNINNFTDYANHILMKEICQYSYLARHTIYFERSLVEDVLTSILKKQKKEKIPFVVEICAPNSLTTCKIIDKCDKLLLFTASHNAYSLMTKLESKTAKRFLPPNVSLRLCHLNPEYMMHQYPDELTGKVDFLVLGYGAGSQINDLTRFIRYAYNWLSDNGILFISVYNKEAIVLSKHHIHDQRFENSPLYISDYWTYISNEQTSLLKKLNAYSIENLQSTFRSFFDMQDFKTYTYPYISALINPSEYSREVLDEIREADKLFASNGTHGQLINAIVRKNSSKPLNNSSAEIKDFLNKYHIPYDYYNHTPAPDSSSLKQSLQAKNISMSNTTLLKTVVLQEKKQKYCQKKHWIYAILPYDKMVAYDHTNYELVQEASLIQKFNQGTISPLTILAENDHNHNSGFRIFLLNNDRINTEYVIMGGGSNSESILIKTSLFRKIIAQTNVTIHNIIE